MKENISGGSLVSFLWFLRKASRLKYLVPNTLLRYCRVFEYSLTGCNAFPHTIKYGWRLGTEEIGVAYVQTVFIAKWLYCKFYTLYTVHIIHF
jgi:hypothetical protein